MEIEFTDRYGGIITLDQSMSLLPRVVTHYNNYNYAEVHCGMCGVVLHRSQYENNYPSRSFYWHYPWDQINYSACKHGYTYSELKAGG